MSKSGVYMIKNNENGKMYVGSTTHFDRRWKQHFRELISLSHPNQHLQSAWNKYGAASFSFHILEQTSELLAREQHWIDEFESWRRDRGYNIDRFVCERKVLSAETRERIRQARLANPHTLTEEGRKRMSEAHKGENNHNYGRPRNEQVRAKIKTTKARNPQTGEKNHFYGKHHSEETKQKIRANNEKRAASNRARRAKMSIEQEQQYYARWIEGELQRNLAKEAGMSFPGFTRLLKRVRLLRGDSSARGHKHSADTIARLKAIKANRVYALTESEIEDCLERFQHGASKASLARRYGVRSATIARALQIRLSKTDN